MRGAWIEIFSQIPRAQISRSSLPMRGAWIEIKHDIKSLPHADVAPHAGNAVKLR